MRPLNLTIEGLRSFRQRVEIPFENRQLLAIVGDTGVGKSSLLEAITYALYSGATWTAHNRDLICDTVPDMLVELSFLADGKTYTVTRSSSRTRPATAKLHCHDDDHTVDNVRTVNAQIERLIGLDRDTFLKSVILPQGRFAELLTSTPGERNQVLRNIFRVDVLDTVRESAKTVRDRLYPHVEGLKQRLDVLPDEPAAKLRDAKAAKKDATSIAKTLESARKVADKLDEQRHRSFERAEELDDIIGELEHVDTSGVVVELDTISEREKELTSKRAALEKKVKTTKTHVDQLKVKRKAETADGLDDKALARAQMTLESLIETVPELASDLGTLSSDEAALAASQDATVEVVQHAAQRKAERDKARAAAEKTSSALRTTEDMLRNAEGKLERALAASADRGAADEGVRKAEQRLASAREAAEKAETAVATAEAEAQEAEHAFAHLQRLNAAAQAAEGAAAGDPCPVCDQLLPKSFRPPKAARLEKARGKRDKAAHADTQAKTRAATAVQAVRDASERLDESKRHLTTAKKSERQAASTAATALTCKKVDLAKPPDQLLKPLTSAVEKARTTDETARSAANNADGAASQADVEATRHKEATKAEVRRLRDIRRSCEGRLRAIGRNVGYLPDALRPDLGPLSSLEQVKLEALVPEPVIEVQRVADERLERITKLDDEAAAASDELEQLAEDRIDMEGQFAEEVSAQQEELSAKLQDLASTLKSVSDRLGAKSSAIRVIPNNLATTIENINREHAALHRSAKGTRKEHAAVEEKTAAKIADILSANGVRDLEDLAEHLAEVKGQERDAIKDVTEAEANVKTAKRLKSQLGVGSQLIDDLHNLRAILSKFTAEVLGRRSQALLAVASQRLGEMTANRYAFTSEFQVLDEFTGQPRGPDTLSGGESFLASLSLALGMVDLAGRAGGRLDALFLDEGFGGLDDVNLSAAIDALEATSQEGRMVAVISHVKAVADRIQDVLLVVGQPRGSRAVWLDDAERAEVSDHDVASAMRGLLD